MTASGRNRGAPAARRAAAEKRGRRAETIAALWLMAHGWRILARRRKLPSIEVDIVARRGDVLAVVEVKQRPTVEAALAALTPAAARRLRQAAERLAAEHAASRRPPSARVDLLVLAPGRWPRHIAGVQ